MDPLSSSTAANRALSTAIEASPALNPTPNTLNPTPLLRPASSLVFIDSAVADAQFLAANVTAGSEVHVLDPTQDAIAQITNTLLGRENIASVQILSHGEAGGLDFANSALNLSNLQRYATQMQSWKSALTEDADILLYGCDVAQGELGKAFVSIMSQLTGADVAASDDLTGSAAFGGDWVLEYQTGQIEAGLALSASTIQAYSGVLAPAILKNIAAGATGSNPSYLTNVNGTLYFNAYDSTNGTELWKSDGTTVGTVLVKDIYAGTNGSNPYNLTNVNGTLYFAANDSTNGTELWKSDGTTAGTVLVKDIAAGAPSSSPSNLTNVNGTLYFAAYDSTNGTELWKSDGTTAGTVLVKNIAAGATGSGPYNLTNVNGTLYFNAYDSTNGTELWKSDGTTVGTVLVKDIYAGTNGSTPYNLTNVNGKLYFQANDGTNGTELWKSDGTTVGTVLVKNIAAGAPSSSPYNLTNVNGTLYFNAYDSTNGTELWKSDGTTAGTVLVKDIYAGTNGSNPSYLTNVNGTLYFQANDGTNGTELWKESINVAPAVTVSGTPLAYTENDSATVIDVTASVADSDSADFDTGKLTVDYTAGGSVDDILAIRNQGTAAGQIGISGSNVTFGGTTIGTFTGGSGTAPLVVTFNSNATPTAVSALLQNLTYANGSDTPSTTARTVRFVITDGDGGTSTAVTKTINVTAVNDAPTIAAPASLSVTEDVATSLTGISFADLDAGSNSVTVTLTIPNGTLAATTGSGVTVGGTATALTLSGTLANLNAFIAANNLSYTTAANLTTTQTLTVSINDNGNTGGAAQSASTNLTIVVTPVNDAPVLDAAASPTLTAVNEDAAAPTGAVGTLVSQLVDLNPPAGGLDNVSDVDANPVTGIAITAADTTNGTWFYSTNNGGTWTALGTVSDTNARLLAADANTRLYFQPNANYNGTLANAITFRAWDQTPTSTNGSTADTSTNGGSSAFSSVTDTAAITVNAINDAPVLGNNTFAITEGGTLTLSGPNLSATDVDNTAASLIFNVSGVTNGQFELVSSPGTAITSFTQAQVAGSQVRFVHTGSEAAPTFNLSVSDGTDSTTPVAGAITFTNVNDAPSFTGNATLSAISEDAANPVGSTIASLFAGKVTDPDAGASLSGVAVISNTANATTEGTWQMSANGGTSWRDIGPVGEGNPVGALALSASTLIRFVPVANYNGTPTGLTVRAIDDTYTGSFADNTTNATINTTAIRGGTTPISDNTAAIAISVTAVNDAPSVALPSAGISYTENGASVLLDAGATIADIDSPDFAGGSLTVRVASGGAASDRLTIQTGGVTLDGRRVLVSGTQIGTYTGGFGTDNLVISLNSAANATNVQTLLRAIAYSSTDERLSTTATSRTVEVTLNDGDGGTSTAVTKNVTVTGVNDAPLIGDQRILYNGALNSNPAAQGWTAVITGSTETVGSGATTLNSNANIASYAGYTRTSPISLDATQGFVLSFQAQVLTETLNPTVGSGADKNGDGKPDRAGFSVLLISNDNTRAIELGFTKTGSGLRIWAQEDGTSQTTASTQAGSANDTNLLFTQAEGVDVADPALGAYDLAFKGNTYTLFLNGTAILSGKLRNYTAATGLNPYSTPNLIFFGDDTTSASGSFSLASVGVTVSGNIPAQTTNEDNSTSAIPVGVFDLETAATALTITSTSSNTTLVPNANLAIGGAGAVRTITATPATNQSGSTTINLSVSDAIATTATNFNLTVNPVNDAPSLTGNATLAAVNEDTTNPPGQTIATLFSGKFSDPDPGATLSGLAITANSATAAQGAWQYSTDGGTNWFNVGTVADGATALALSASTLVRFLPVANYNGTPSNLTVRGLDNTYSGSFTTGASRINVNTSSGNRGTIYPIASGTDDIITSITAVNDAPSFTAGANQTVTSGTGSQSVANWATGFVAGPANESSQLIAGYEIVSNDNPGLFSVAPTIATNGTLSYTPSTTTGTATIGVRVQDNGGTTNGGSDKSAIQYFTITINPQLVSLSTIDATAAETVSGTDTGVYRITRNATGGAQTIQIAIDAASTAAIADYGLALDSASIAAGATLNISGSTITVNLPNGVASADLVMTPVDDIQAEAAETLKLNLVAGSTYTINSTNNTGTVTIAQADFVVINTNDSGEGSLRQAVLNANAIAGTDTINFQIPGTGVQTINLAAALPAITDQVIFNGYSQAGATQNTLAVGNDANLKIVLNGSGAGSGTNGIVLNSGAAGSTIQGLVIQNFQGSGIVLSGGSDGNTIRGNFIGTDVTGTIDLGNAQHGILLSSSNNLIGGTTAAARNVISGNNQVGLLFFSGSNTIQGNYIGTNAAGTQDLGNGNDGLQIQSGNNLIGGAVAGAGNLISGNDRLGMLLAGSQTQGNQIQGNFIGINSSGTLALGNSSMGIVLQGGAANNTIGGAGAARNIISGNQDGINVDPQASSTLIQNNYIGTDVTGTVGLGNRANGINLGNVNNIVSGNLISGNNGVGVSIYNNGANNILQGNRIGTQADGKTALGNSLHGVSIASTGNNTIGGTNAGDGNTIAFNGGDGVFIQNSTNTGNRILGNAIHSNADLGIDLAPNGVTANDLGDADTGPNNLQNFPVLGAVSGTNVKGALNSTANTTFRLEFFANATGNNEGEIYLGFQDVTTDASGNATINYSYSAVAGKSVITATATNLATGDTSEFSIVNQAPSLTADATLTAILEDATSISGATIASLFSGKFNDPDAGSSLSGLAIVGNLANASTQGTWQYSTDGTNWYAIGTVGDDATALALSANTNLRFVPVANYNGTPPSLTVRAIDNTYSSFTNGATRVILDATSNGGQNAISANTKVISTSITAVNDAPDFTAGGNQTSVAGSGSQTVMNWATGFDAGPTDEDATQSVLSYEIVSNDNPSLFAAGGAPTIASNGTLTYTPGTTAGTATIQVRVRDTGGTTNGGVDTSTTKTFTITVNPQTVNLTAPDATAVEGGTDNGTFRLSRGAITGGNLIVNLTIDGSSTATSSDYTLSGGSVTISGSNVQITIPNGQSFVDVNLAAIAEAVGFAEGNDTLRLNLAAGSYTIGSSTNATVTIAQNGFTVINTNDSGEGSLRQAILNANAIAGTDTITFAGSTFTDVTPDTITLTSGQLSINSNLTIQGTGANLLTVSGNNASRVFLVNPGAIASLSGLTISRGNAFGGFGGGIYNNGTLTLNNSTLSSNTASSGGGIWNEGGTLTLNNSTLSGNSAPVRAGGGITINGGTVSLNNSTLSGNSAGDFGGGIDNNGNLTVSNSTFSGNTATNNGGALWNYNTLALSNSTFSGNTAANGGGIYRFNGSTINTLQNNLFADSSLLNVAPDATNLVGTAAALGLDPVLRNNGGPTQTHALLAGSAAINAGSNIGVSTTDQTGNPRIVNKLVDIGAVESPFDRVSISAQDATATELPGNPGVYRIGRDNNVGDLVVNLTIATSSTATATDYTVSNNVSVSGSNLSVTIPDGQDFVEITLTPVNDSAEEGTETLTLNVATGNYSINPTQATASIDILDAPIVTVSVPDASASESTPNSGSFRLTRTGDPSQNLVVNYTITGTATNGSDYTTLTGTATISAGQSSVDVFVNPINDTIAELDETIQLSLAAGNYNLGNTTNGTVTILANDPTIRIVPVNASQSEGNSGTSGYAFTVELSNASDEIVTVDYATADGTATTDDNDYIAKSGTLTFNPGGPLSQTVTVDITSDTKYETDQTFTVDLNNAGNGSIVPANSSATGTILNDDVRPTITINNVSQAEGNSGTTAYIFTVELSNASDEVVTVNYATANGTATTDDNDYIAKSGTLTFNPGGPLSQTVTIDVTGDTKYETDQTFTVDLSNAVNGSIVPANASATGTILNDDARPTIAINNVSQAEGNSGTTAYTLTVTLSHTSDEVVTVNYTTADGTATTADGDYVAKTGTLTFNPGDPLTQTITVDVTGDTKYEADQTFAINLGNVSNGVISTTQGAAIGTILNDDDRPTIRLTPSSRQNEGNSGTTNHTFTASLSNASDEVVTVGYTTTDGTATTADNDYTAQAGTLTFNPGVTSQTIVIAANGDMKFEADQTFQVNLTEASNGSISEAEQVATATIVNDDARPTVSITPVNPRQLEGNVGTRSYNFIVALSNASDEAVTVNYSTANGSATAGSDYVAIGTTALTFSPGGPLTQTIRVTVNGDSTFEADETFTVNLSGVNNGSVSLAQGTATGTILNDDGQSIYNFGSARYVTQEGNTTNTSRVVTITRSNNINVDSAIEVVMSAGSATAGSDFVSRTVRVDFAAGQTVATVPVEILGDTRAEADETLTLSLVNPGSTGQLGAQAQTTLTIANDDAVPVYNFSTSNYRALEGDGLHMVPLAITRSGNLSRASSVQVQLSNGSAIAGRDFVGGSITISFEAGQSLAYLPVQILGNSLLEADKTLNLSFVGFSEKGGYGAQAQASLTIVNDDTAFRKGKGRSGLKIKKIKKPKIRKRK